MKKTFILFLFLFLALNISASAQYSGLFTPQPENYSISAIIDWARGGANIASYTQHPGLFLGFEGQIIVDATATDTPRLQRLIASSTDPNILLPVDFVTAGHPAVDFAAAKITASSAALLDVSIYADNAAAITGGLLAGDIYRTATGALMIVYEP